DLPAVPRRHGGRRDRRWIGVEQWVVRAPALVQQLVVVPQQLEWRRRPLELTQFRARRRRIEEVVTVADLDGVQFSRRT
ncbi:MAG TPA: hypothetical protein VFP09_05820, partial [Desertimonas sp.]|nr:hypothetical protein [Desertimonas sp.]